MEFYSRTGKRLLDIVLLVLGLVVLLPAIIIITIVVLVCLGRPVFFRQVRPGYGGRPFTIYKFRTMSENRDQAGNLLPDAARMTSLGRILRSLSLDELPEIFNVLKGEMSLVGPRPLLMKYLDLYTPEQSRRHEVKPGITGWTQINGRNALTWEQKFAFDVWYVDHLCLWLDLKIMVLTLWKILIREGISHPGQATMEEFKGGRGNNGP
ncbi:sugar transferase [candidate division CSSED10-310 bacterium]|uniref:Sugar transferase n=1 Tax=candidate division CSSED10-310 bacterium TaxID=2855610 RepID=A0ABV6Z3I6_UNCC1